jgi:hypothetical protein
MSLQERDTRMTILDLDHAESAYETLRFGESWGERIEELKFVVHLLSGLLLREHSLPDFELDRSVEQDHGTERNIGRRR